MADRSGDIGCSAPPLGARVRESFRRPLRLPEVSQDAAHQRLAGYFEFADWNRQTAELLESRGKHKAPDIGTAFDCKRAIELGLTPTEAVRRIREGESLDD